MEIKSKEVLIREKSALFFNTKLVVTCLFSLIGLTLNLLNIISLPAFSLIVFGALWNFFVDINTFYSFLLSLFVGIIFAMLAVIDGLYLSALLYLVYYIPLQFVVWICYPRSFDLSIKKNKDISNRGGLYVSCVILVVFYFCLFVGFSLKNQVLPVFDAVAVCLLGLSAFLQTFMFREYYIVRILADAVSVALWISVYFVNVLSMGAIAIVLMYLMYMVLDIVSYIFWIKTNEICDQEALQKTDVKGNKKLVQEKVEEYRKMVINNSPSINNDDNINA